MFTSDAANIEQEYNAHSPWNCVPTERGIKASTSCGVVSNLYSKKFRRWSMSAFSLLNEPCSKHLRGKVNTFANMEATASAQKNIAHL
jgi:hypothetical protein